MSPNLYDLLDVDETASTDEVRAAWKAAVADLDPTDRRFRAYNDAAGVLLDPDKRATYDAGLERARAEEDAADSPEDAAADPVEEPEEQPHEPEEPEEPEESDEPHEPEESDEPDEPLDPVDEGPEEEPDEPAAGGPSRRAWWAVAAIAVAAVVALVLVLLLPGVTDEESPAQAADAQSRIEEDGTSAQVAAQELVVPVLGYDYRTMDEDLTAIQARMTEDMAATQAESWPSLTDEAEQQRIVVTAQAPYVALTRLSEDGRTATVVAFIDQQVRKRGTEPFTLRMWATLTMVRDGEDWLLDDICTEGDCS